MAKTQDGMEESAPQQGRGGRIRRFLYEHGIGQIRPGAVGGQTHSIRKDLRYEFARNEALLKKLVEIESAWADMEGEYNEAVTLCKKIIEAEPNPYLIKTARAILGQQGLGSGGEFKEGTPIFALREVIIPHSGFDERLYALGSNINSLTLAWSQAETATMGNLRTNPDLSGAMAQLEKAISDILHQMQGVENKYHGIMKEVDDNLPSIGKRRGKLLKHYNKYSPLIRFRHTYKVIKPFVYGKVGGETIRFRDANPHFQKYDWEKSLGCDENNFPLEINDEGEMLLDRWMAEIWQNDWQRGIIQKKEGGGEFLRRCGIVHDAGIRKVDPQFAEEDAYIDLIEMGAYILNEIDAVRDDLRDGRYHLHSKTATDYIIYSERGLARLGTKGSPESIRGDPRMYTYVDAILRDKIPFMYNQLAPPNSPHYVNARPEMFMTRSEEDKVERVYSILAFPSGLRVKDERHPTDLNPAFDRRALHSVQPFLHWGKMNYYEDSNGINRFSENPYPCISTRGIAKYILFFIATKTMGLHEAAAVAEKGIGYDISVRDLGAEFTKNPFGSGAEVRKAA